jgi:hypothetical protein
MIENRPSNSSCPSCGALLLEKCPSAYEPNTLVTQSGSQCWIVQRPHRDASRETGTDRSRFFENETGAVVRQPSEVLLVQQFRSVRGGLTRGDVASAGIDVISVKQCLAEESVDVLVGC